MTVCPYCRRSCPNEMKECPYCGREIGGWCSRCGSWVRNDWEECPKCGEPWALGMIRSARMSRKKAAGQEEEREESLAAAPIGRVAEPAEKEEALKKEGWPSFRQALFGVDYSAARNELAREALGLECAYIRAWIVRGENYMGLIMMFTLFGLLPGSWATDWLRLPTNKGDIGQLVIMLSMAVTGLIGWLLMTLAGNWIAASAGVTHQKILNEVRRDRDNQKILNERRRNRENRKNSRSSSRRER